MLGDDVGDVVGDVVGLVVGEEVGDDVGEFDRLPKEVRGTHVAAASHCENTVFRAFAQFSPRFLPAPQIPKREKSRQFETTTTLSSFTKLRLVAESFENCGCPSGAVGHNKQTLSSEPPWVATAA